MSEKNPVSIQTKAVIFDQDGVLIDTAAFHEAAFRDLARRQGFHMSDTFFLDSFGMQNQQSLPMLAGRPLSGLEIQEWSDWKEQRYRELITGRMCLLGGVRELLADLRRHGYKTAIGTSAPRANVTFMMDQTQTHGLFDRVACSEDVRRGKPAPDTFLKAADMLGAPPCACLVVEDAIVGVEAALAAGMKVLAVTNTRTRAELARAHRVVDSLAEVKAADVDSLLFG